ncbi:MAG: hypothetical protein JW795_05255 [Chitinivibrionales bacterium]|nr:hypothetical protein [Chitinivibrionales bacterium]
MKSIDHFRQFLGVTLFFLKTTYFSPATNPLFLIIGILCLVLGMQHSLGKHEIVLLLILLTGTHWMIPSWKYGGVQEDDSGQSTCLTLLPLSARFLAAGALTAAAVYALVNGGIYLFFLHRVETLPAYAASPEALFTNKVCANNDTLNILISPLYDAGGFVTADTLYFEPSLLFQNLPSNMSLQCGYILLLAGLFYIADTCRQYSTTFSSRRPAASFRFLNTIHYSLIAVFGIILAADTLLPARLIRRICVEMSSLTALLQLLVLGAVTITIFFIIRLWQEVRSA